MDLFRHHFDASGRTCFVGTASVVVPYILAAGIDSTELAYSGPLVAPSLPGVRTHKFPGDYKTRLPLSYLLLH